MVIYMKTLKKQKTSIAIVGIVTALCIVMAVIDGVLQANYFVKSGVKLILFLGVPALYAFADRNVQIKPLFVADKKGIGYALGLCVGVYVVILGGYLLLRNVFDFSSITASLTANIGVNRNNFVFVSLYISFVNSLLEEFFFRGFAFITLKRVATAKFAYLFSAATFALYHVAMMIGWFSPVVFIIVMAGLFAGGMIFNYLNAKSGTIYPSWFVHMFANFAINTIGFMLFGII
ncbi:MAG: CPBP family intramembrane metalloprotease [Ruminococcaceae bacterium]|nr:CPBP family intramembrane metalloprotease [Oscillospiraceae bacterium]